MMDGLLNFLLKPLLKELSDPVEKCRELAIGIIAELCASMHVTDFLPLLLPVLVSRLGSEEVTEPSEELRLQLLCLLSSLVQACACGMAPYLDDMILILQRTIVDPYPELKKESCHCVLHVATAVPVVFYQQSSSLVKPLLRCMTHQHSKVRMAAIKALGCAVRKGSATAIDDALSPLAQRVSDSTPSVRSCLVDMLADWLLHQPDRYSYHHKLIPLLLICMSDEVPDISNKAHILWEKIGAQFENENEDDLKDQMDFMQIVETMPGLPFDRPRLGCRVLIYRCFSKILPALLKDIADWTVNSRIKASQLLFILLYHLEEHATHHIHAIINALYKACQDEDSTVVKQVSTCRYSMCQKQAQKQATWLTKVAIKPHMLKLL
jgi:dynein assembly factor 5